MGLLIDNLMVYKMMLAQRLKEIFTDEKGEVNIVAIVVLIGIAVVLAIVFRKAIGKLLNTLFGTITENAENAIKPE